MLTTIVKTTPRYVIHLLMAAILWVLVFGVVAGAFLGLAFSVKGWATHPTVSNPSTAIHTSVTR